MEPATERNVTNDLHVGIATRLQENVHLSSTVRLFRALTCLLLLGLRCVCVCNECVCVVWVCAVCVCGCVAVCGCVCVAHTLKIKENIYK